MSEISFGTWVAGGLMWAEMQKYARNAAQAEQNAAASDVSLSAEENSWISEKLAGLVIEQ